MPYSLPDAHNALTSRPPCFSTGNTVMHPWLVPPANNSTPLQGFPASLSHPKRLDAILPLLHMFPTIKPYEQEPHVRILKVLLETEIWVSSRVFSTAGRPLREVPHCWKSWKHRLPEPRKPVQNDFQIFNTSFPSIDMCCNVL